VLLVYRNTDFLKKEQTSVSHLKQNLPERLSTVIKKLVNLHTVTGNNRLSLFNTIYGILLLFLAVSSFFMFKFSTRKSKRGFALTGLGIMLTIVFFALI